tara:strand:+ start:1074 stop:1487 length:414 start_codon:yes stop_codon:yes gene_type:complete
MKLCNICKTSKPVNQFYTKDSKYLRYICKQCHSKDGVNRRKNYKEKAIAYKGGCCSKCSYNTSNRALEFHHMDPSKKDFTFSKSLRSFKSSITEIDKCVLLCSNCHRETHEEQVDSCDDYHTGNIKCTQCNIQKDSS